MVKRSLAVYEVDERRCVGAMRSQTKAAPTQKTDDIIEGAGRQINVVEARVECF